jgi:hypothetical protein
MTHSLVVDINYLREILEYHPETGLLFWKDRPSARNNWRSRFSGKEAFINVSNRGYKRGAIDGKNYQAHRVAWALFYNEWPDGQIDHIDHDKTNNKISNLRIVSNVENHRNRPITKRNKSGTHGVRWSERDKKWYATIGVNLKQKYIGIFDNLDAAIEARKLAEKQFEFHENHGT